MKNLYLLCYLLSYNVIKFVRSCFNITKMFFLYIILLVCLYLYIDWLIFLSMLYNCYWVINLEVIIGEFITWKVAKGYHRLKYFQVNLGRMFWRSISKSILLWSNEERINQERDWKRLERIDVSPSSIFGFFVLFV